MIDWLLIFAPLVFGFGSKAIVNVIHAGHEDVEHGIKQALPALGSSYLIYIAYTVVIGFTYGWLLHHFPQIVTIMKYVSIAAMCGLAYLILMRSKRIATENYLSLNEEFLIQALSPIVPLIVFVLFSVFLDVTRPLGLQVIVMSLGFVILNFVTQLSWVIASQVLEDEIFSEKTVTLFDRVMAGLYVLLAAYIVIV